MYKWNCRIRDDSLRRDAMTILSFYKLQRTRKFNCSLLENTAGLLKYVVLPFAFLATGCIGEDEGTFSNGVTSEVEEVEIVLESVGQFTSVSSLGSSGFSESWNISQIDLTDPENIEYSNVGKYSSNNEVEDVLNSLPYGFYEIELSVETGSGISLSRALYISERSGVREIRIAHKVGKSVIRKLITSVDRGWVGSFMRRYFSDKVNQNIEKYVISELRKLLKREQVFRQNVETAIHDGLVKAGASSSIARRVATLITIWF